MDSHLLHLDLFSYKDKPNVYKGLMISTTNIGGLEYYVWFDKSLNDKNFKCLCNRDDTPGNPSFSYCMILGYLEEKSYIHV